MRLCFLLISFLLFVSLANGQSLYREQGEQRQKIYSTSTEMHIVSFEKTTYGLRFHKEYPKEVEGLILRFMDKDHPNFNHLGKYRLTLINRDTKYYIVERESPERLILID